MIELHRESVGEIRLDDELGEGEFRALSTAEIHSINVNASV